MGHPKIGRKGTTEKRKTGFSSQSRLALAILSAASRSRLPPSPVTRTGIPLRSLRVVSGIREISDSTIVSASSDGLFPSVTLILRLPGGKGGFGSLLRGAATKAGQKKTNNFDACRDMSGRQLRHVNAEKKLEEWKAEAEDRRLEKLAEDFLMKKAKEVKKNSTVAVEKYLEKYREDAEKCMEEVEESVRQSFALYKESKRKILPLSEPSSKRQKKMETTTDEIGSGQGSCCARRSPSPSASIRDLNCRSVPLWTSTVTTSIVKPFFSKIWIFLQQISEGILDIG